MPSISYTVFEDLACTQVRSVVSLCGQEAGRAIKGFKIEKGGAPKEGDIILACRIDRICFEDTAESA